jgi:hypothetical protein
VVATYYCADSENGDHIDDPSEDALFELISDLNDTDNTFVVIQPDQDEPVWFASVAVLEDGGYEVVRRDASRREHDVRVEVNPSRIANDLTTWVAARHSTQRPAPHISTFQNRP